MRLWQGICIYQERAPPVIDEIISIEGIKMSQDVSGSLMLDDEFEQEIDHLSWEDDQGFGLTDTDLQVMTTIGWTPEDLTIEENRMRYRQYLAKKQ